MVARKKKRKKKALRLAQEETFEMPSEEEDPTIGLWLLNSTALASAHRKTRYNKASKKAIQQTSQKWM